MIQYFKNLLFINNKLLYYNTNLFKDKNIFQMKSILYSVYIGYKMIQKIYKDLLCEIVCEKYFYLTYL